MNMAVRKSDNLVFYYVIVNKNVTDDLLSLPTISRDLDLAVWTKADGSFICLSVVEKGGTCDEYTLISKEKYGAVILFDDKGTPRYRYDDTRSFFEEWDDFKAEEIWRYAKVFAAQEVVPLVYFYLRDYLILNNKINMHVQVEIGYRTIEVTLLRRYRHQLTVVSEFFAFDDTEAEIKKKSLKLADKMNAEIVKSNNGNWDYHNNKDK